MKNQYFKAILDNSPESIVLIGKNHEVLSFNKKIKEVLQRYFKREIKEGDFYYPDFVVESNWELYMLGFNTAMQGETFLVHDHTENNNVSFWFEYKTAPIYDEDGSLLGISLSAKDITERKKIEKEAESYSKRLSLILESITDAFFTVDRNFTVTYWNNQAAKVIAVDQEHIIGRNLWDVFPSAVNSKFYSEYNRAITENVSVRFEEYFEPQQAWLDVSAYPSEEGLSIYFRDITASKNNYQHLVKTETDVRNFARQLNTILEEERTRIAREIHDEFGQQLAGIKMSISSIKRLVGEQDNIKLKLEEVVEDVDNTIQSLRSFATELRPGILDTMGLLASLEWLAKEFEKKSKIKCFVDISVQEQEFEKAFSTCYFRICQEALTNVLKHANAQNVVIKVYEAHNHLVLEVIDDGIGIMENKIQNPFSMGILGMKERANLIGGSLVIKEATLGGTVVQLKAKINAD